MKRQTCMALIGLMLVMAMCLIAPASRTIAQNASNSSNAAQAFDRLKTLAGHWEATTPKGQVATTFQLTANGTALLERMNMPGEAEMVTVYYLDGNRLLLTHYCEAGNQPRMQAGPFDTKAGVIDFSFVDATNLSNPNAGHMHHAVIKIAGPNEVSEAWTFFQGGKPAFTVPLAYHRVN